ncbi:PAS domain S-box protein [Solirubrobacter sp. CPCC 204708]|uniref:histidine kinase n=1 Tax=Solirubrobacter deserti TaxID=2282478 RepID=A0ABT4RHU9_9ACTN|nr:PAS domain S-box protein [Solirubrobacter deserti]MBE2316531.1 PAS domain S-box protein [Solirubrobacter deserti]MDA0138065.1 PAS domain S-box protein [Solirubrobacter deserti]
MDESSPPSELQLGDSFARILTETTQSLVCVMDREGRILLFNEACERATGYSRNEVLGRLAQDFVIPSEEREAFSDFLAFVWRTGTSSPQVGHWRTKDGGRRLIAWSNQVMDGTGLITTGIDLTDRESNRDSALEGDPEAKLIEVSRVANEHKALRRVATLVASEATPERIFVSVSAEVARVLQVNATAVVRYVGDGTAEMVGRHNRDSADVLPLGTKLPLDDGSALAQVARTSAPARIDDWGGSSAAERFRYGYRSTAAAPIVVSGVLWGAVAIASEQVLPPDTENRLGDFAELVSLAVASAQARSDLIASRARLVKAGDDQRRKLERNLHDGAQSRLVSVALQLRTARAVLERRPEMVPGLLEEAAKELDAGLAELREIARGLHPALLVDHGLARALEALVERLELPVTLDVPDERLPETIEATAYYIASEALTNVAKHAHASTASVTIVQDGGVVRCSISDDGRGGADPAGGTGLLGLRDRAEALGGTLSFVSPPGRGTTIVAALPLSSATL